jgi:hypothetical protein
MKRLILAALLLLLPAFAAPARAASTDAAVAKEKPALALRFTKHAEQRMKERGVDHDTVRGIIGSVKPFKYWHQGKWKTGYYDVQKRVFIATDGNVVITVIADAEPRYVEGLKRKKP